MIAVEFLIRLFFHSWKMTVSILQTDHGCRSLSSPVNQEGLCLGKIRREKRVTGGVGAVNDVHWGWGAVLGAW